MKTKRIEECFALLEKAAIAGERCPQGAPFGPLQPHDTMALARAGRILIEIRRTVTILTGPHAGKKTLADPSGCAPYKIVGVKTFLHGVEEEMRDTTPKRAGPSAPRAIGGLRDLKEGGR
jgi:hypothetical protein